MFRFAVLGDPVRHSRSPAIHEVLFDLSGLEGEYTAVRADRHLLTEMIQGLRKGEWHGLNITMPLKGAAAAAADRLSSDAARARSVNTLLCRDDSIVGESTDCSTFRLLLDEGGLGRSRQVLVLGAGGSAAAALSAVNTSHTIYLSARRREQALGLSDRLGGEVLDWGTAVAGAIVINTTPLGMHGEPLPEGLVTVASALIDLPYAPSPTPSIIDAERSAIPHVGGFEFLIRQAIASFALWTDVEVPYDRVEAALRKT